MAGVFESLGNIMLEAYSSLTGALPPFAKSFISFFLIAILIVIYSVIIYRFYKSITKKNLFSLNLGKYNKTQHPIGFKVVEGILYFVEYAIILPLIILLWFIVLTILLMLLTERSVDTLLLISATLIVAIRMTSYYHHDLSIELAKLVPFTLLATSLVSPEFFSVERVIGQIALIPGVFGHIFYYLFLIVIVEVVLRGFELLSSFFQEDTEVIRKK